MSDRIRSTRYLGLGALLLMTLTSRAWALDDSDKEAIRKLSNDAVADYNGGHFDTAREKFARAYALAKVPKLAVWLARAHAQMGRLVSAYELYRQAIRLERSELWVGDAQLVAQQDAEKELAQLTPRLAKVTVLVEGVPAEEVEVRIDDVTVPSALLGVERLVDPGTREVTGLRKGEIVRQSVSVAEGGKSTVALKFGVPASPGAPIVSSQPASGGHENVTRASSAPSLDIDSARTPSNPQRTWGYISLGVGAVGLVGGTLAGVVVASKYSNLNESCPNRQCDSSLQGKVDSYDTMQTVSTVGFIVGGVGTAVGLTLLLTSPKVATPVAVRQRMDLQLAPNWAAVRGTF